MRIHIATDHAGLEFSKDLQEHLRSAGHEVVDHGPREYDPLDDYPAFCINAALAVVADQAAGVECLGIVSAAPMSRQSTPSTEAMAPALRAARPLSICAMSTTSSCPYRR